MGQWKKPFAIVALVAAVLLVGVGIYNNKENRLKRQLDLGYRYLENEQYEEAVVAFEKAIEIDERCMEAYASGIWAYQNLDNMEETQAFYVQAQAAIQTLDAESLAENLEYIVDIYLAAKDIYGEDLEWAAEILEGGLDKTEQNPTIKEALDDINTSLEEIRTKEESAGDLSWAEELYDALMADDFNTVITEMENWQALIPKCEPYLMEDWGYWDYESAYRIPVSDTEILGVVVYMQSDNPENLSEIYVFIGGWDGQEGFESIGWGDKMASYGCWNPEELRWLTLDGVNYQWYGSDEGSMILEEDYGVILWHA